MASPLAPIHRRQQRDVNLLYAALGDSIAASFARHATPGQPLTWDARQRILADVRAGLDVIWGRFPGDPDAALRAVVLRDTADARARPLTAAVRAWRQAMGRTLAERVEAGARGEGAPM